MNTGLRPPADETLFQFDVSRLFQLPQMCREVSICRADLVAKFAKDRRTYTGEVGHDAKPQTAVNDVINVIVIEGVFA